MCLKGKRSLRGHRYFGTTPTVNLDKRGAQGLEGGGGLVRKLGRFFGGFGSEPLNSRTRFLAKDSTLVSLRKGYLDGEKYDEMKDRTL